MSGGAAMPQGDAGGGEGAAGANVRGIWLNVCNNS